LRTILPVSRGRTRTWGEEAKKRGQGGEGRRKSQTHAAFLERRARNSVRRAKSREGKGRKAGKELHGQLDLGGDRDSNTTKKTKMGVRG